MTITRYLDSDRLPVFHAEIDGVSYLAWMDRLPITPSSPYGAMGWESSRMIGSVEDNKLVYPEELDPESDVYVDVQTAISETIAAGDEL